MEENKNVEIEEVNEIDTVNEEDEVTTTESGSDVSSLLIAAGIGVVIYEGGKFIVKKALVPGVKKLAKFVNDKINKTEPNVVADVEANEVEDDEEDEELPEDEEPEKEEKKVKKSKKVKTEEKTETEEEKKTE